MAEKLDKVVPPTGLGIDQAGGPVVDPTKNVISLVEAEKQRADDLRSADRMLSTASISHIRELINLQSEIAKLRVYYDERLVNAEAKRIDAIRAVDVNAVSVASQRASDQATVLAAQVATSAEALRALVATTATTVASSQQQLATTLSTRLTTLEQAQYEGKGKQSYADPAMRDLVEEMRSLRESRATAHGKGLGVDASWVVIMGIITALSMAFGIYSAVRSASPPTQYMYTQPTPLPAPVPLPIPKQTIN